MPVVWMGSNHVGEKSMGSAHACTGGLCGNRVRVSEARWMCTAVVSTAECSTSACHGHPSVCSRGYPQIVSDVPTTDPQSRRGIVRLGLGLKSDFSLGLGLGQLGCCDLFCCCSLFSKAPEAPCPAHQSQPVAFGALTGQPPVATAIAAPDPAWPMLALARQQHVVAAPFLSFPCPAAW